MLIELSVKNLGVVDALTLSIPSGMIALTGETGAGKTLLVDAISLLVGARADPKLVRSGAAEAVVDGRFELDGKEVILSRVVAAEGRSKAYIDGRPSTAAALAEVGAQLVDLHGQHAHQSLLSKEAQRNALDVFAQIDLSSLQDAEASVAEIDQKLLAMGGDDRSRARELDLVRYQVTELEAAELSDPNEVATLKAAEEILANAGDNQDLVNGALEKLAGDSAVRDSLAKVVKKFEGNLLFAEISERLTNVVSDIDDIADSIRTLGDTVEQDPEQLAFLQSRRNQLQELCRKYGDDLPAVIAERDMLVTRLKELEEYDSLAAELDGLRCAAVEKLEQTQQVVKAEREAAAPDLAAAIESQLPALAMAKAKVSIGVAGVAGVDVSFLLAANPGSALLPLAKVASGGELARTMLALRSVLSEAPPVLVFDEVDAGIGGQAGFAVGRSLSNLGDKHQVMVVTHLPQVAAFADAHLAVEKRQGEDVTVSNIRLLSKDEQVIEIARMLSGQPNSDSAQIHAKELIDSAADARSGPG